GGYSRNWYASPKHSFSLRFRNAYGKGKLDYPLFEGSSAHEFDSIWLRSVFNNSWISRRGDQRARGMMLRDLWCRETMVAMGHDDAGRDRHVHLYINGIYWGIHILQERQDSAHFAIWHGGTEDDYDARNANKFINGTSAHWNSAVAAINRRDWTAIQNLIDIDSYIDWLITNQYAANTDFRSNGNWRSAGGGSAKARWRFFCWDAEYTFASASWKNMKDPPGLLTTLSMLPEFVVRFGDRLHRHLFNGGTLTPKAAASRWQQRADQINDAIVAESARWGDYRRDVHRYISGPYELYTRNQHFHTELKRLMTSYFPQRTNVVIDYMRGRKLYPTVAAPVFNQHGGRVPTGFRLKATAGGSEIWYTLDGKDPRLPGGKIDPGALRYATPVTITKTTLIKARARKSNSWSALNEALFVVDSVGINEALAINKNGIMDPAGEHEDWIELYNQSSRDVTVSGMYLTDDPANLRKWQIPSGHSIKPGAFLLIWADEDDHQGPLHANFKLSGSGEDLLLVHQDGRTVLDRMTFGPQQSDISVGRFHDGGARTVSFLDPSPRVANDITTCGPRRYSALDPARQPLTLSLVGQPGIGKSVKFETRGGPAKAIHGIFVATGADEIELPFSTSRLLCTPPLFTMAIVT
ncbi:MAG: CotH kinase family protein, partial [Planctomycetota bacterium]|nr:CotH kinase family protein [Planctomycetota bacterium]